AMPSRAVGCAILIIANSARVGMSYDPRHAHDRRMLLSQKGCNSRRSRAWHPRRFENVFMCIGNSIVRQKRPAGCTVIGKESLHFTNKRISMLHRTLAPISIILCFTLLTRAADGPAKETLFTSTPLTEKDSFT